MTRGLMMNEEALQGLTEDWAVIESVLPGDRQDKARELRALFIPKEFKDASTLLRVMLIHLSDGCSLRETAVLARAGAIPQTIYFNLRPLPA